MKTYHSITMLLATLALTFSMGCSSSKKKDYDSEVSTGSESSETTGSSDMATGDSDSGTAGAMKTIYFAYDSSTLTGQAKSILDANAEYLKANGSVEIQIEGHCDERGGVQYNLALGERRANSVKSYISALGVSSDRVSTVSYGKERPKEFGNTEEAWSKNRRANFVITRK